MQADGSALWLKLEVPGDDAGTGFSEQPLPPMTVIEDIPSTAGERPQVIPEEQYLAVRDAAVRVFFENAARQDEIKVLNLDLGMNERTTSALLNNFRCIVQGQVFKAPMRAIGLQLFIDAIVAKRGNIAASRMSACVMFVIDPLEPPARRKKCAIAAGDRSTRTKYRGSTTSSSGISFNSLSDSRS
jgi:hypothetical protein